MKGAILKTMTINIMLLAISLMLLSTPNIFQGVFTQSQPIKSPPVAITNNPDQRVKEGDLVILNGSGSYDPDGEIISYAWGIIDSDDEAPAVPLNGRNTANASFTAPMVVGNVNANSYLFELTVTDNDGLKGTNTSKVVVVKGNS